MPPRFHQWVQGVERDIQEDYDRLHTAAQAWDKIQQAGHGGESTWARMLEEWLPPDYEVGLRKYLIPEVGDDTFETDLVIFRPSYPKALRKREEVLGGGIAAAFSIKLTLDAAGIRDGFERARDIRRGQAMLVGTPRREMLGSFPIGILAHSHDWKADGSTPLENVARNCLDSDIEVCAHPRETVDLICVADLATWTTFRVPYFPPAAAVHTPGISATQVREGYAISSIVGTDPTGTPSPVASFLANLMARLSYDDPTIAPMANSYNAMGSQGRGAGLQRMWELADVFSPEVLQRLSSRGMQGAGDPWGTVL